MTPHLTPSKNWQNSFTIKQASPQGTLWVQIIEKDVGEIDRIFVNIGKGGSVVNAMLAGLAELINTLLKKGSSISEIINHLSGITADRSIVEKGMVITSPLDALIIVLIKYRASVPQELRRSSLGSVLRKR